MSNMMPSRGFVTIATGSEKYFHMAYILLLSYRLSTSDPMPFAVITDKQNKYTAAFDKVVLLEHAACTYNDKLELPLLAPYDETIFIDADCIAFGDLNRYWDCFEGASDFSCFGSKFPIESGRGWYTREGAGKYRNQVPYGVHLHGGIYFIRRSTTCEELHRIAHDIAAHYKEYQFRLFQQPADEPILALSMALVNCVPAPVERWQLAWYMESRNIKADFFRHQLSYSRMQNGELCSFDSCVLMHFGTGHINSPLYLMESRKVLFLHRHGRAWSAPEGLLIRAYCNALYTLFRVRRRLVRMWKQFKNRRPS